MQRQYVKEVNVLRVYQLMLPRGTSVLHVKEVNVLRGDPGERGQRSEG